MQILYLHLDLNFNDTHLFENKKCKKLTHPKRTGLSSRWDSITMKRKTQDDNDDNDEDDDDDGDNNDDEMDDDQMTLVDDNDDRCW